MRRRTLKRELRALGGVLERAQAEGRIRTYALIGSVAVSARARPRATQDIDFLVSADPVFFREILPVWLKEMGYETRVFTGGLDDPVAGLVKVHGGNVDRERLFGLAGRAHVAKDLNDLLKRMRVSF